MKVKQIYKKFGCLVWLLIIVAIGFGIYLLITFLENKQEKAILFSSSEIRKGDSCLYHNDYKKAMEYYLSAYSSFECDSTIARMISCEQINGNYIEASKWLDILAEKTENSDFISIRRSDLQLLSGDTIESIKILDSLIGNPIKLKPTLFYESIIDSWLNSDADYTKASNLFRYYVEYFGKLVAINNRLMLTNENNKFFDIGEKLFTLVEDNIDDYAVMDEYRDLLRNNQSVFSKIFHGSYYGSFHNNLFCNDWNYHTYYTIGIFNYDYSNIVGVVSDLKWSIFNDLLLRKHKYYGVDSAINYAIKITNNNSRNTDTYENYSKFIYGIYSGLKYKNKLSSTLTKNDLDSILICSMDSSGNFPSAYLTIGKAIFENKSNSTLIGDKIVDPIVILGCNEWSCNCDSIPFLSFISNNVGKDKTLKFIDNNYHCCSSSTKEDRFGLSIKNVITNSIVLNVLQAEYDKQQ